MSIESVMPSNHLILCQHLQSFPASGSFPVSRLLASGGQRIAAPFDVVEAASLPMAASVQQTLPWACNLAKRITVNIYTNSMWAFIVSHDFIIYCLHLLLHSIFPSIRIFSSESILHIRWPKYWSFSFNISPSSEYSGLISFKIDWFDLLAVHGTLKSLLQHYS